VDDQGRFHLTFRDGTVYYSNAPVKIASSANSWKKPHQISTPLTGYFSRMALDSQERLHLVYTQDVYDESLKDCPYCSHLFYRRSKDAGSSWTAPVDISKLPLGSVKPQILVDQHDNLHVIWEAGLGGRLGQVSSPASVWYSASHDGGKSWTFPSEFKGAGGKSRNPAIGIDAEGNLLTVWLGLPEDLIYYQTSFDQGSSWSAPRFLPGIWGGWSIYPNRLDSYSMATDNAGNIHLLLVGRTHREQESLSILHLIWNSSNSQWSRPEAITTLSGPVPEWPRLAIGLGKKLHAVWFTRPETEIWTGGGKYQIWYAQGISIAPQIPATLWPTPTPNPGIELSSQSTSTPLFSTDTPKLPPSGSLETKYLYTESDELLTVAIGLSPLVLIIVGLLILRRSRAA
jgi:hypothetical protein